VHYVAFQNLRESVSILKNAEHRIQETAYLIDVKIAARERRFISDLCGLFDEYDS
jgi:hypothetical protein